MRSLAQIIAHMEEAKSYEPCTAKNTLKVVRLKIARAEKQYKQALEVLNSEGIGYENKGAAEQIARIANENSLLVSMERDVRRLTEIQDDVEDYNYRLRELRRMLMLRVFQGLSDETFTRSEAHLLEEMCELAWLIEAK